MWNFYLGVEQLIWSLQRWAVAESSLLKERRMCSGEKSLGWALFLGLKGVTRFSSVDTSVEYLKNKKFQKYFSLEFLLCIFYHLDIWFFSPLNGWWNLIVGHIFIPKPHVIVWWLPNWVWICSLSFLVVLIQYTLKYNFFYHVQRKKNSTFMNQCDDGKGCKLGWSLKNLNHLRGSLSVKMLGNVNRNEINDAELMKKENFLSFVSKFREGWGKGEEEWRWWKCFWRLATTS